MRKLTAAILLFAMVLSSCGCGKTKVKMLVKEYRSGHGIAGQDYSGYREYEIRNLKEGDAIVGGYAGSELRLAENKQGAENGWVIKIGAISNDGVVVTTRDGTMTRTYGIPMSFDSPGHMVDGPNYSYMITFI
ncbi:MAG: hypothetical protein IKZ42_03345 [Clostridiales bacterium]|nr:hypothetical protein [Clostridiales bacterium]